MTAALDQITDKDSVYECMVQRANVQCTAVITLSLEYPAVPPLVSVRGIEYSTLIGCQRSGD